MRVIVFSQRLQPEHTVVCLREQRAIATDLSADGRFMASQDHGYLSLIKTGFRKYVDLISFFLFELCVYGAPLPLVGEKSFLCYAACPHTEPVELHLPIEPKSAP